MNTSMNRCSALSLVVLISLTTTGCSFFADKFDRLRSRYSSEQPVDPTNTTQPPQIVAATPAPDTPTMTEAAPAAEPEVMAATALKLDIDDRVLVKQIQNKLNLLGFDAGRPDGVAGPKTLMALARFRDMAGVLSNPDLGGMLQQVVAANEAGAEPDKPWWARRLPADGMANDAGRMVEATQPGSAEQDVTSQADIVATAEQLRKDGAQSLPATDSANTSALQEALDERVDPKPVNAVQPTVPQASLDQNQGQGIIIPPSVGMSAETANPSMLNANIASTDLGVLNQEAMAVNERLVGNGIAGERRLDGRYNTAMVDTKNLHNPADVTVDSIDLSALAPPAIGISRSTEPEKRTFVSRVKGAWSSTKKRVRSTFSRDDSSTAIQSTDEGTLVPINPDSN